MSWITRTRGGSRGSTAPWPRRTSRSSRFPALRQPRPGRWSMAIATSMGPRPGRSASSGPRPRRSRRARSALRRRTPGPRPRSRAPRRVARSLTTTNRHSCMFRADGARRAASRLGRALLPHGLAPGAHALSRPDRLVHVHGHFSFLRRASPVDLFRDDWCRRSMVRAMRARSSFSSARGSLGFGSRFRTPPSPCPGPSRGSAAWAFARSPSSRMTVEAAHVLETDAGIQVLRCAPS